MKISTKLTVYFTIAVFILVVFILIFLHESIVNSRIDEEINSIQSRGESHRDVLEDNYTQQTLQHIALMESKTSAIVVVTDKQKNIIISSDKVSDGMVRVIEKTFVASYPNSNMLKNDYRNDDYIVSVSSYRANSQEGYIFMFKPTGPLRKLIKELNSHFLIAGWLSLALMIIIHFILSKILTRPLIKMKSATERINRGDYDVMLPQAGNDEIGQLSQAIQKLSDDLKTIKAERAEFLASISHELRTPLTYVQGYTTIAQRKEIGEQERREYLQIIEEETGTIVQLVENLFELAKLDENTFTIYKETVEIGPLLNRLYTKVKPAFVNQNIQLHFVNCTTNMVIYADPIRLEQIFLNLLDNAKKYSNKDTMVTLTVTSDSKNAIFSLEDEGIGIPEDEIPNIFTRLYRVEKSRSREHGGSGLGLSIVKELVEAHSGDIQVKSTIGKGTIIQLFIPIKEGSK
ncbi:cell wall metabolism sensor histidine kinase WalK [Rossellomorea aquimaris]|uniref:histidine kinase n=1 Tax=Rossellomorea aquimaris TaxID=189382 RepID=A0A366ETW7_9BACI|nr:HAMP domain-containing sensor histidine kinase [Rossellomorea aquimaris]RBP05356.1 signal transduction histidine kinase [Rossellomorea aquimaris]